MSSCCLLRQSSQSVVARTVLHALEAAPLSVFTTHAEVVKVHPLLLSVLVRAAPLHAAHSQAVAAVGRVSLVSGERQPPLGFRLSDSVARIAAVDLVLVILLLLAVVTLKALDVTAPCHHVIQILRYKEQRVSHQRTANHARDIA